MPHKPAVVIVHGAFHPPACYDSLTKKLKAAGFEVLVPRLAMLGAGIVGVTIDDNAAAIIRTVEPIFVSGREVILVAHSYGGVPATLTVRNNGIEERRARGESGGFKAVVYLAATLAKQGENAVTPGSPKDHLGYEEHNGKTSVFVSNKNLARGFYYNSSSKEEGDRCLKLLEPCSADVFITPLPISLFTATTVPRIYVLCTRDNSVPIANQENMVALSPGMKSIRLDSDHSPFLSHSDSLVDIISSLV